jgi:tetratricopeptide (TPR) repeat protein
VIERIGRKFILNFGERLEKRLTEEWELVFAQAVAFHGRGQLAEAGSLLAAILEHNAGHLASLQRLAAIRRFQGRLEESRELLARALERFPDSADLHNSLGNTLNALERTEEAVAAYRRATELRGDFPEAHLNLANSLKALGRYEEAVAAYREAITKRNGYAEAHTNLGVVLDRLHRLEEALASFLEALRLDPRARLAFNNVGLALSALNRHEEALGFFEQARAVEPEALEPVFHEAIVRLAMGDFARGWRDYEARLGLRVTSEFSQPVWDGKADLSGKTILLRAEQGLGDTILFARYIPAVVKTGARVVVEAQQPLVGLLRGMAGVAQVVMPGQTAEFDVHIAMGSLPLIFGTIPGREGYFRAPAVAVEKGRVGVCWAGNPKYALDYRRSIPLAIFQRLFGVSRRFVSLQKEWRAGDEEILAGIGNLDLGPIRNVEDLAETAALLARMELVITVDTAIAHLAGALGRPVWVLLPFSSYWVWGRRAEDCDWYASARLFRQQKAGDWEGVCVRLAQGLEEIG